MLRIALVLHAMIATTVMGIGIIFVLTMGMDGWQPIAVAAAVGFVLSIPLSWYVARRIVTLRERSR